MDSKQMVVFRISGSTAAEMRMVSVSAELLPGCREIDISRDLSSVFAEPPPDAERTR
jgi:hypothetical protein